MAALSGCAALGFSDAVLWRVGSPDGQLIAVCQEVPVVDGPDFELRLERPDGSFVRHLYISGDGDPCSEVVWSPDGQMLGVLSGHVARAKFVDVGWALAHPDVQIDHRTRREVSLSSERVPLRGHDLRFVAPMTVELVVCPAAPGSTGDCGAGSSLRRFDIPESQATDTSALSATLRDHLKNERFQIVSSIRGLPLGVRDSLQSLFGSGLDIAEPGAPFQGTGANVTTSLPTRRLVAAGCSADHCLVYYERGGTDHTWLVALFHWTPAATRFEWGGLAPKGLATMDEVRTGVLSGVIKGPAKSW